MLSLVGVTLKSPLTRRLKDLANATVTIDFHIVTMKSPFTRRLKVNIHNLFKPSSLSYNEISIY